MFIPENDLEKALMLAATDPVARPDFYTALAASEIFVPHYGPAAAVHDGQLTLAPGTSLNFQPVRKGDQEMLPIFSSLSRLQSFVSTETRYLKMKAVEFLSLTQGADLVLNPGSDYGKEFTSAETARLLDGSLWQPLETFVAETATEVLLGQPARYPYALTEALSHLFKTLKDVQCAYLTHFHDPSRSDSPHTLIGIKATGDWNDIVGRAGIVLADVEVPDPPVDFLRMDGSGGLEDYLLTTKPFYKRKTFGLF